MAKILVIDDDDDFLNMITQSLRFEHYLIESAADGETAYLMIRTRDYDMAILDWDLPGITGIEVCKKYRAHGGKIPVLLLTGKTEVGEKILGLDSGADDYLTKPFDIEELRARVRALLRRADKQLTGDNLHHRDIVLEPSNYRVTKSGKELKLIPKEFTILELLMRHPGKVFSPEAIVDRAWDASEGPVTDVIRTHIMNLRRKLGGEVIETVHGVGYKITSEK